MENMIYGAVAAVFLIVKNPDRKYLIPVATMVFALFAIADLPAMGLELSYFMITWSILTFGLIVFYGLRFQSKPKNAINFIKLVAMLMVVVYPLAIAYGYDRANGGLSFMLGIVLLSILVYDRYLIKEPVLKRKSIIVFVLQSGFVIVMCTFAFWQKIEADKQRAMADQMRVLSQEQMARSKEHNEILRSNMQAKIDSLTKLVQATHRP